jgi:heme-degrading monooxygenase HmoA
MYEDVFAMMWKDLDSAVHTLPGLRETYILESVSQYVQSENHRVRIYRY